MSGFQVNAPGESQPRRPGSADLIRLLREELSQGEVLLYDASGRPILKDEELWAPGQAEARRQAHLLLGRVLDSVRLTESLAASEPGQTPDGRRSEVKYTIDVVDGKLSLPLEINVGHVKLKAHLPLYRLGALAAAAGSAWTARNFQDKPAESHGAPITSREFPLWRVIRLGTHRSSAELALALSRATFKVDYLAAEFLKAVTVAPAETEVELVRVSLDDLGIRLSVDHTHFTPDGRLGAPVTFALVNSHAAELGLGLLPAEAGPQLRLQYPDQQPGEILNVGTQQLQLGAAVVERLAEARLRHLQHEPSLLPRRLLLPPVIGGDPGGDPGLPRGWHLRPGWRQPMRRVLLRSIGAAHLFTVGRLSMGPQHSFLSESSERFVGFGYYVFARSKIHGFGD